MCYAFAMKNKPLSETNPFLKNTGAYEKFLNVSVTSSTAIELGNVSPEILKAIKRKSSSKLIYPIGGE